MALPGTGCCFIRVTIRPCDSRMPFSSSAPPPNWKMSYQARMRMPWLMVTGRTGACGNTKRTGFGSLSSGTTGSKSCPSAPRPCSQITAAAGREPVSISSASMREVYDLVEGGNDLKRIFAGLALALLTVSGFGQGYPSRPVRMVIGFTPGGGVDINARLLAAKLTELLGQQVIVENKPGAGTNIANEHVAKSAPDGYTLLFNSSAFAINLALYRSPPYALRDFAGVSVFSESVNLLVVSSSLAARSLQDLVALARERPGALNYSSAGAGTSQHMAAELFKLRTGTDIVHV